MSTFRRKYRELSLDEAELVEEVKTCAEKLERAINDAPASRHKSLALTKLEESVMWAVKGITG